MQHHATFVHLLLIATYLLTLNNSDTAVRGVLKIFCKFHRKAPVLESLFYKVASLQACNVTKNRLLHKCFPVKFEKFWKTPILKNIWTNASVYCYFILYLFLQSSTVHVLHFYWEILYYAIKTIELMMCEVVSFEKVFYWTKFLAFES